MTRCPTDNGNERAGPPVGQREASSTTVVSKKLVSKKDRVSKKLTQQERRGQRSARAIARSTRVA